MIGLVKRYPVLTFFVIIVALGWLAVFVGTTWMPIDEEHPMTALPIHVIHWAGNVLGLIALLLTPAGGG